MYQVLLRLSQMRPISHTYACWGVSFTDAQPASIASTPRIAGPSRRVTRVAVRERAVGTTRASFGDRQAVGRDSSRPSSLPGAASERLTCVDSRWESLVNVRRRR